MYGWPTVLESRWNGEAGLGRTYRFGEWNAWNPRVDVQWERLRAYARDMQARLLGSLADLSEADLQMQVDMTLSPGGTDLRQWRGIDIYVLHGWSHVYVHGGEIACLKGIQGEQGYIGGYRPEELFP
jgi:hypothetical protein